MRSKMVTEGIPREAECLCTLIVLLLGVAAGAAREVAKDAQDTSLKPLRVWLVAIDGGADLATTDAPNKSFESAFFDSPQRSWQTRPTFRLTLGTYLSNRSSVQFELDRSHAEDVRDERSNSSVVFSHTIRSRFDTSHYSALLAFRPSVSRINLAYLAGMGIERSTVDGSIYPIGGQTALLRRRTAGSHIVMTLGADASTPVGRGFELACGVRTHVMWTGEFARLQPNVGLRWKSSRPERGREGR